ncbi:hypothetical protein HK15_13425 [Acetobacter orientalis]|uniref:Phosphate starvation-inducible protein PsiF n=1 Tax=Acetobacter orientalis TaxID=146474 RepID=A0A252B312_9PROT|nr:hypothetical protein HK15_13425 [Acetobacter orientalis]
MGIRKHAVIKPLCLVVMGVACLATSTLARADSLREQQTAACKGDAVKLCTLAIPNEEKITKCMEKKKDKLSPKCRAFFDKGLKDKKASEKK